MAALVFLLLPCLVSGRFRLVALFLLVWFSWGWRGSSCLGGQADLEGGEAQVGYILYMFHWSVDVSLVLSFFYPILLSASLRYVLFYLPPFRFLDFGKFLCRLRQPRGQLE